MGGGGACGSEGLKLRLGLELEECMRDLVWWSLCWVNDLGRRRIIRWDSSFVIRSRGRWGKCG